MADTNTCLQFLLLVILSSGFFSLETVKLSHCNSINNVSCIETERKALLKFKDGLTDPSGQLSSWVGRDCCKWRGVVCDRRSANIIKLKLGNVYASDPDGYGAVYALGGQVNPSLLELQHLRYLDLSMNNFEGNPIPSFIGSLKKLRYLNLSGASFGGNIPTRLGNLSRLQYLDLNSYFNESIDDNDLNWLSGFSSLKYLNLGNVDLSKSGSNWLQALNKVPSLVELHLSGCTLTNLPISAPFLNLTSLSVLDLSKNGFNASIPSWLFNITSLVYIDLSSNNLHGELPDEFAQLHSLQHLDLSENSFISGKLSRNLGKLCNLRALDLSFNIISGEIKEFIDGLSKCDNCSLELLNLGYNQLGGELPSSLGHLPNLKYLRLVKNSFSGSIPDTIGNLSSLKEFYLALNQMKTIPASLGQLSGLVALDLSGNQWEGVLTEAHFANLTSLKELNIALTTSNVTLFLNVSPNWTPPFKLKYLNLKACHVGPKFPAWLRHQDELTSVAIWRAGISDIIPDWFWKLDLFLNELDFSYNQLTGTIPSTIRFQSQAVVFLNYNQFSGPLPLLSSNVSSFHLDNNIFSGPIPDDFGVRMPMLTDIDISTNLLNGTIPTSISEISSLLLLRLYNNQLTGKIPEIWNNLPMVYLIDLSNNRLSGNIPASFGSLSSLMYLALSNNNISGEIPTSLQNCTIMQTLDLGDNRLSGEVPGWIGEKMPSLLLLSLRSNLFSGEIPMHLCSLESLHLIDLAVNNFSGAIPSCIGNLTGMTTVVTSERYEGELFVVAKGRVMQYLDTLYLVNTLDLSSNNLSGKIPSKIANLVRLGTLNLSMNHLTGKIPDEIGKLRWLETLDVSSNKLSGSIPPSMAAITSLNHLNVSYNNLSGVIPTTNQFQTLNDPSIYEGNPGLCGQPLPNKCGGDNEASQPPAAEENDDDNNMFWFYIGLGPGFAIGFWAFFGTLIMKKSWRHAFFKYIDNKIDSLIVIFLVNFNRLKRFLKQKEN